MGIQFSSFITMRSLVVVASLIVAVGEDASFSGPGTVECFGAMRVYPGADAECFPVAGMPAPQGYNMDGDSTGDGSYDTHFVITENHGTALCEGTDITYIRNDMGLGYCGGQPDPDPTSLTFLGTSSARGKSQPSALVWSQTAMDLAL